MSNVPKGRRTKSKQEFDAIQFRIHDEAVDMIKNNFHAKGVNVTNNLGYIEASGK